MQLTHAQIIERATGCIYCNKFSKFSIEHMPPRNMFKNVRPNGWVFACCNTCNQGSSGADALAGMMAHLEAVADDKWKVDRIRDLLRSAKKRIPGIEHEIFGTDLEDSYVLHNGLLRPIKKIRANGPLTRKYLNIFSAKLAMAGFSHFTDRPIKQTGLIHTEWYLNGGISEATYRHIISVMPGYAQLVQGVQQSGKQFHLRFNTNKTDIVAAMVSFNDAFFVTFIATDNVEFLQPLRQMFGKISKSDRPTVNLTTPGLPDIEEQGL